MKKISLKPVLTIVLLLTALTAFSRRAKEGEYPPKALLVVLKTRATQVRYLNARKPANLPKLQKDIKGVMRATINDFDAHFDYCPVFYFIDTMANEIKAGHFEGVLLDKNMQPVKQSVLAEGDTTFFVGDFGYMSEITAADSDGPMATTSNEILLVKDHQFNVLKWPKPAIARGFFGAGNLRTRDAYRSTDYQIDYIPRASAYSRTLRRYYRN